SDALFHQCPSRAGSQVEHSGQGQDEHALSIPLSSCVALTKLVLCGMSNPPGRGRGAGWRQTAERNTEPLGILHGREIRKWWGPLGQLQQGGPLSSHASSLMIELVRCGSSAV